MKTPLLVLIILFAAGAGFAGGALYQSRKTETGENRAPYRARQSPQTEARYAELQAELQDREQRIEDLEEQLKAETAAPTPETDPMAAPPDDEPEAAAPADSASSPRLFADRYHGALRRVDWKLIGEKTSRMATLIPEIIEYVAAGKEPPLAKAQEIGSLNRPIVLEALKLGEGVPGTGVNGQFTDPAVILNVLATTLENMEMPLSENQKERLVAIADRAMAEDVRRREAYDDTSFALMKLLDEVELKGRFFDAVFAELTPEQSAILSPPVTKDRIRADLFSEALIYAGGVDVFPFENREKLTDVVYERVKRLLDSDETLVQQARGPVERWVDQLPQEDLMAETNELDKQGMLVVSRATRWGRHELALLESLVSELSLSEEMAKGIRGLQGVVVPVK